MHFVTDGWVTLDRQSEDDRMTETIKTWRAEPLAWGRGPHQFEMFLEPTCPYSAKAFAKLDDTLAAAGTDNITIKQACTRSHGTCILA